jgi:hypothetical protein
MSANRAQTFLFFDLLESWVLDKITAKSLGLKDLLLKYYEVRT